MRKITPLVLLLFVATLSACSRNNNVEECDTGYTKIDDVCVEDDINQEPIDEDLGTISGFEDATSIVGHYFNPMKGVSVKTDSGRDISSMLAITGHVDYSTVGTYELEYTLEFDGETLLQNRTITVAEGTYNTPTGSRPSMTTGEVTSGDGSYFVGLDSNNEHPMNPTNIAQDLLNTAVPSSGWWTSLLVINQGGGNGIYTNPLRVAYSNQGMEITNPEDGFVQYWNPEGYQTIAQFPISLRDSYLMSSNLQGSYTTQVIDYGDSHVKVALRNSGSTIDHMVTTLVQGSPYIFVETEDKDALHYTFDVNGVDGYEYYQVDGTPITSTTYTGSAIVIKMVHRHSGYDTTPPANVGAPQYSDKFYLINAPENTVFTISSAGHPFGLNNRVAMSLGDSNYISIAALNNLSEAPYYHQNGYTFIEDTDVSFAIDYNTSVVTTQYQYTARNVDDDTTSVPLLALMPHHYKHSDATPSSYSYRTVRGTLKILESASFTTELLFRGLLPGFTMPTNNEFSSQTTVGYLQDLDNRIDTTDMESFINDEGPYWNSKAIYPLAQAIIIADQLGEETLKNSFIDKLKYVLEDWYTYDGVTDEKFLFYNKAWGSVYYSNDDFGTASQLSDHSFTHGYLIYASSVLAMYDTEFVTDYKDLVDLLLDDYMYPVKEDSEFAYLRNFDPWAGHTWAHGFGTFAEGNNLESTSEALNSWNGGYQWALATGDQERMEAAIYGFVTELSAIKEYWFDYDDTNWDPAFGDYVDVAGMVWGGKHDYATWFGANPTFIYGIQWLPTGEYLTGYALTDEEYTKFSSIFATYLEAKDGTIDTWYSNMWAIQAIVDPDAAITMFDSTKILNDDYPNELVGSYWMIHAMASLERRSTDVWMGVDQDVSSTIYENSNGDLYAMIWNASDSSETVKFYTETGLLTTITVEAQSFTTVSLND